MTDGEKLVQQTLDNRIIPGKEIRKISSRKLIQRRYISIGNQNGKISSEDSTNLGVTYVTSPSFLIDLYSNYDFEEVELIIGHGYMDGYKKQLEGNEAEINTLFSRVSDNTLTIFGTKATIHSKIYILTNDEITRIIVGSPNLSYNAEGSRQREYAWYVDIHADDYDALPFLQKINNDYQKHLNESDIVRFMEDLQNLRKNSQNERKEDFLIWSGATDNEDGRKLIRGIIKDVETIAFSEDCDSEDLFQIRIPETATKDQKKILTRNLNGSIRNGVVTISKTHFRDEISNLGMPRMKIDQEGNVTLGLGGQKIILPTEVSREELHRSLSDIEAYIELVEKATCFHKEAVKMNMMEAILTLWRLHSQMSGCVRRERFEDLQIEPVQNIL